MSGRPLLIPSSLHVRGYSWISSHNASAITEVRCRGAGGDVIVHDVKLLEDGVARTVVHCVEQQLVLVEVAQHVRRTVDENELLVEVCIEDRHRWVHEHLQCSAVSTRTQRREQRVSSTLKPCR